MCPDYVRHGFAVADICFLAILMWICRAILQACLFPWRNRGLGNDGRDGKFGEAVQNFAIDAGFQPFAPSGFPCWLAISSSARTDISAAGRVAARSSAIAPGKTAED